MLENIWRKLEGHLIGQGVCLPLSLLWDRLIFYSFYRFYYQRVFKSYGNNIRWGRDFRRLVIPKSVRISCPQKISIGDGCQFDDFVFLQCDEKGEGISIEAGVRINTHAHILSGSHIQIQKNVLIAPFALISSNNHAYEKNEAIMFQGMKPSGAIVIGRGSWIAQRASILGGVNLGERSVVAAGATVTRGSYPACTTLLSPAAEEKKS